MKILQYSTKGDFIRSFDSINDIKDAIGIEDPSHIYKCLKGKRNSAHGFVWKYDEVSKFTYSVEDEEYIASIPDTKNSFTEEAIRRELGLDSEIWHCSKIDAGKHEGFIKNAQKKVEKVTLRNAKAYFTRKAVDKPSDTFYKEFLDRVSKRARDHYGSAITTFPKVNDDVYFIGDMHIGALEKEEGNGYTAEYNSELASKALRQASEYINSNKDSNANIALMGDFIESFTGKNHKDTWKYIYKHGMEIAVEAFDKIQEFLSSINKLGSVYIVGGNHDRISDTKDDDQYGQVAWFIYQMLKRANPDLDIIYDKRILVFDVGGIRYIAQHGHLPLSKLKMNDLIVDYGDNNKFNFIVSAHLHHRKIVDDSKNGRMIVIPSLTPTNHYAADLGRHSLCGFVRVQENCGMPITTDIPIKL